MICITWEHDGSSGCTVCPESEMQTVIDRLTQSGHVILSIANLP